MSHGIRSHWREVALLPYQDRDGLWGCWLALDTVHGPSASGRLSTLTQYGTPRSALEAGRRLMAVCVHPHAGSRAFHPNHSELRKRKRGSAYQPKQWARAQG